ncbi:DotA/TraY family protein [Gilliamella sp. ESL0250]|nr:DotA/TraY family protein [Gilliamella sp. ESL0250]
MKKDGWMLAGSWSIRLIQIQEILGQLANLTPISVESSFSFEQLWQGTELSSVMNKASNDLEASSANSKHVNGLTQQALAKYEQYEQKDKKDGNAGSRAITGIFNGINKEASNTFSFSINPFWDGNASAHSLVKTMQDSAGSINPITIAKYYGDLAINLGSIVISVSAGVAGVAGIFSGSIVGNALIAVVAFMPISVSLWVVGNSLSVLLPLMPYMLWLGIIGGWMILVLEAMVAAPLWVVTQLQPDADGFTGKGSTGYGLVLSLALRPTLMIIGLICAIEMLNILGGLLSETFPAMLALTGIAGGSIIKTIAILFVYFGVLYSIINKSFSLIHVIPDEVMKWLNVNAGQSLASYAKES